MIRRFNVTGLNYRTSPPALRSGSQKSFGQKNRTDRVHQHAHAHATFPRANQRFQKFPAHRTFLEDVNLQTYRLVAAPIAASIAGKISSPAHSHWLVELESVSGDIGSPYLGATGFSNHNAGTGGDGITEFDFAVSSGCLIFNQ